MPNLRADLREKGLWGEEVYDRGMEVDVILHCPTQKTDKDQDEQPQSPSTLINTTSYHDISAAFNVNIGSATYRWNATFLELAVKDAAKLLLHVLQEVWVTFHLVEKACVLRLS